MSLDLYGKHGSKYHASGAVTGVKYQSLVVRSNTVFTAVTWSHIDGTTADNTSALTNWNISGVTLTQGAYLTPDLGWYISAFTTSSGSVIGYKTDGLH